MATTPRQSLTCIVNGRKTVQVASNGVAMRRISYYSLAVDYRFQGAGTPRKKVARPSRVCMTPRMTHSEESRAAESGLRLPNKTEYSFGDFMAPNTPS